MCVKIRNILCFKDGESNGGFASNYKFLYGFVRGDQNVEIPISFNQRRKMNLPVSASASIGGKSFAAATNPLN